MVRFIKQRKNQIQEQAVNEDVRLTVSNMIADIARRGDQAVREYSERFDHWSPKTFRLSESEIKSLIAEVPEQVLEDIRFAQAQVRRFAEAQRSTIHDLEVETLPGVILGHRVIPVESAGCYIPGGRYPLVSSAHMGIIPAKVAGVQRVIACTPPFQGRPSAATVAAIALAGADEIYILGGVQAIAAMALGTETIAPVDIIVGPGNAYVTEAKRQLFGIVGIDLFAGPSEVLVIADDSADVEMVAADLLGQAEHGINSPATLLTNSSRLAHALQDEIERQLQTLPTAAVASAAWQDYGEIILADTTEEMIVEANRIASEHVEVLTHNRDEFLEKLTNYGSLFLGPETTVPYGDLVIGTNHILPTERAARFTGGLWVGKFLKTLTYQRCTPQASARIGEICSRLAELEGIWGHKKQADLRIQRYKTS